MRGCKQSEALSNDRSEALDYYRERGHLILPQMISEEEMEWLVNNGSTTKFPDNDVIAILNRKLWLTVRGLLNSPQGAPLYFGYNFCQDFYNPFRDKNIYLWLPLSLKHQSEILQPGAVLFFNQESELETVKRYQNALRKANLGIAAFFAKS